MAQTAPWGLLFPGFMGGVPQGFLPQEDMTQPDPRGGMGGAWPVLNPQSNPQPQQSSAPPSSLDMSGVGRAAAGVRNIGNAPAANPPSFMGGLQNFLNPDTLVALGGGIARGDFVGGLQDAYKGMQAGKVRTATQNWLIRNGYAKDAQEADALTYQPDLIKTLVAANAKTGENKLPTSYQEYQLAKQEGYKGSFTDWQTKSARTQDPTFQREFDLRKEYTQEPNYKNYIVVRDNYERIRSSAQASQQAETSGQPTGPTDISLIFAYMKMLDPNSVVREGEFATAQNSGGVPQQISTLYNNLINGAKLSPDLRSQFVTSADQLYSQTAQNLADTNRRYSDIAQGWQLDASRIFQNPENYPSAAPPAVTASPGGVGGKTSTGVPWSVSP